MRLDGRSGRAPCAPLPPRRPGVGRARARTGRGPVGAGQWGRPGRPTARPRRARCRRRPARTGDRRCRARRAGRPGRAAMRYACATSRTRLRTACSTRTYILTSDSIGARSSAYPRATAICWSWPRAPGKASVMQARSRWNFQSIHCRRPGEDRPPRWIATSPAWGWSRCSTAIP